MREPEAFLRRTVTRLCLDQLKSAQRRHETYFGPGLPDPVLAEEEEGEEDVTLPLMLALERLSPLERAAFLLHLDCRRGGLARRATSCNHPRAVKRSTGTSCIRSGRRRRMLRALSAEERERLLAQLQRIADSG